MCQNENISCWECQERVNCWNLLKPHEIVLNLDDTLRRWDQVNKE